MSKRRPFGVTLWLWLVLILSAWGAIRFFGALRWWDILDEFDARLSPLYLAISGAVWAVAGVVLLWSAWSREAWAYWTVPLAITLWLAAYWIERLFFQESRANLPFALIASTLLLILTAIIAFNRNTRSFFIRSEEYE